MSNLKQYAGYRIVDDATGTFVDLIVGAPAPPEIGQIIFDRFKVVAIKDRTVRVELARDPELQCRKCGAMNRVWKGHAADAITGGDIVACGNCGNPISFAAATNALRKCRKLL